MNISSLFAPSPAAKTAFSFDRLHAATAARASASSDSVSISAAAREAQAVDARLAEIKSKDALSRSQADQDYLLANDKELARINDKARQSPGSLSADEIDYQQKAGGFVNTFANLSPAEKALYDKAVAGGNQEAADGIAQIALIRMGGHVAGGANGRTYDPLDTEITAANIERYFRYSIIDPSGVAERKFQALSQFLQSNSAVA